jgi:predicted nucleic acid-binding protein
VAEPRYLIDTSVLARAHLDEIGERLERLAMSGKFWTCRIVDLEIAYASRARDVVDVIAERLALPEAPVTREVMNRALHVASLMAVAGKHRGAKPADLVIAAAAEARGLTVLHYDADYDRISKVTGQPTEWVARAGSL